VFAPERFAVDLPNVGNHPYFDSVNIDRDMDVALIARLADIEEAHFRQLNPSHNKPVIMAAGTPTILLPWDNALLFIDRIAAHTGPTATWTAWRVPRNMSVVNVAQQHGITEARLREVNRIPPRMALRAGATILVPRQGQLDRDVPVTLADRGQILLISDAAGAQRVRVQRGDTLGSIARRYGVSVANIRRWNGMGNSSLIRAGQVLVLHARNVAASTAGPSTASVSTKRPATAPSSRPQASSSSKTPVR
jgi:membrane-bound lytic murein transglycosylase D